jgi:hypothetical protein
MSKRITWYVTVKKIEERFVRRWVKGVGNEAVFSKDSEGWYVVFAEWAAAAHVGKDKPDFEPGDCVKMTMEKVS